MLDLYSILQADSKVKFAAWPKTWRPPVADRLWPRGNKSELSHMTGALDDSTINIVVVIIIIIIKLTVSTRVKCNAAAFRFNK